MMDEEAFAPELADTAAELRDVLGAWRLSPERRRALQQRALLLAEQRSWRSGWRALRAERWLPAALGGAVLAAAAGTAIGVALSRGRRQQHTAPA